MMGLRLTYSDDISDDGVCSSDSLGGSTVIHFVFGTEEACGEIGSGATSSRAGEAKAFSGSDEGQRFGFDSADGCTSN